MMKKSDSKSFDLGRIYEDNHRMKRGEGPSGKWRKKDGDSLVV